jgi:hypothetical protein
MDMYLIVIRKAGAESVGVVFSRDVVPPAARVHML